MVPNQTDLHKNSERDGGLALDHAQREWVESIGMLLQHAGFPPSSARIYAVLLIAAEPELTFDDFRSTLGFSKAAVSTGLQRLLQMERISERTRPGERRRYFRARVGPNVGLDRFRTFNAALCQLLEQGLALRAGGADSTLTSELEASVGFLRFLQGELDQIATRWEEISHG